MSLSSENYWRFITPPFFFALSGCCLTDAHCNSISMQDELTQLNTEKANSQHVETVFWWFKHFVPGSIPQALPLPVNVKIDGIDEPYTRDILLRVANCSEDTSVNFFDIGSEHFSSNTIDGMWDPIDTVIGAPVNKSQEQHQDIQSECDTLPRLSSTEACILRAYVLDNNDVNCQTTKLSIFNLNREPVLNIPRSRQVDRKHCQATKLLYFDDPHCKEVDPKFSVIRRNNENVLFYNDLSLQQPCAMHDLICLAAKSEMRTRDNYFLTTLPSTVDEVATWPFARALRKSGENLSIPENMIHYLDWVLNELTEHLPSTRQSWQTFSGIDVSYNEVPTQLAVTLEAVRYSGQHVYWFSVEPAKYKKFIRVENPKIYISGSLIQNIFLFCLDTFAIISVDRHSKTGAPSSIWEEDAISKATRTDAASHAAKRTIDCLRDVVAFPLAHELAHVYLSENPRTLEYSEELADCAAVWHLSSINWPIRTDVLTMVIVFSSPNTPNVFGHVSDSTINKIKHRIDLIEKWAKYAKKIKYEHKYFSFCKNSIARH